jgi:hypothetical protein
MFRGYIDLIIFHRIHHAKQYNQHILVEYVVRVNFAPKIEYRPMLLKDHLCIVSHPRTQLKPHQYFVEVYELPYLVNTKTWENTASKFGRVCSRMSVFGGL